MCSATVMETLAFFSWVHIGKLLNPGYIATSTWPGPVTLALIVRPEC